MSEDRTTEPGSFGLATTLPLVLAILAVWVPYSSFLGSKVPAARDLLTYFYPLKAHLAEAVRSGQLPWIDRYRWGGAPLLGSPGSAPFDPGNFLFFLLPLGAATKAWILLRLATAVAGFAAFSRRWGLSSGTAAAAGVLYALGGIGVSLVPFLAALAAYSLLPWFGAFWIDLMRAPGRRSVLRLSIVSALIFLSSCPEFFFYTVLLGLFLVATCHRDVSSRGRSETWRVIGLGAASALLAMGIAAQALLPGIATAAQSVRGGMKERSGAHGALEGVRLKEILGSGFGPDWTRVSASPGLAYPYLPSLTPGRIAVALSVVGLLLGGAGRLPAAAMTAFGTLLALGPATFVWILTVRLFPPLVTLRYPEKHMVLAGFGFAWLAALGLGALEKRIRPSRMGIFAFAVGAVQLTDRSGVARRLTRMEEGSLLTSPPPLVQSLKAAGPKGQTDDSPPLRLFPNDSYVPKPIMNSNNVEEATVTLFNSLMPEYASVFGIGYMFEIDYDLSLPRTVYEWTTLMSRAAPTGSPVFGNLLRAVGVNALIRSERRPDGRFESRLYFTAHPLPPFRFVPRMVVQRDGLRRFGMMLNEGFRSDTAYVRKLSGGVPAQLGHGRIIQLRDRASGLELLVEVTGEHPAFLLVNRLHEAACEGELDGRPIEVAETGADFAGVLIPPGRHQLRLRPETRWVKIGALMSLLSLLVLASVCSGSRSEISGRGQP